MSDHSSSLEQDETSEPAALLRELERLAGVSCAACSRRLCGHEVLFSVALGLKDQPRCLGCLAEGLHRSTTDLRDQLAEYVQHRDCYRQAWDVASDREGLPRSRHPACLWPDAGMTSGSTLPRPALEQPLNRGEEVSPIAAWDAGEMSCGDLVLALRLRLGDLPGGAVLLVTARDPAAPEDLPAWCRMTGHRLLRADHPLYFIQRKEQ